MLAATASALYRFTSTVNDPEMILDRPCRAVAEGHGLLVAADEDGRIGIYRGERWIWRDTGLSSSVESLLILDADPLDVLIGTEPPQIHRLTSDGVSEANESFGSLGCRSKWRTPWGGPPAVRSLAASPDGWVYADIHVGSIMRSSDRGLTWEPVTPSLNDDVHQVNTCPAAPDRIYADTAHAVYISDDRGDSWRYAGDDMDGRYGRAICAHPAMPDLILATVSDGPHGDNVHGQLWATDDAGASWQHVCRGFPEFTEDNINTFHITFDAAGRAWACVGNALYATSDPFGKWDVAWQARTPIAILSSAQN